MPQTTGDAPPCHPVDHRGKMKPARSEQRNAGHRREFLRFCDTADGNVRAHLDLNSSVETFAFGGGACLRTCWSESINPTNMPLRNNMRYTLSWDNIFINAIPAARENRGRRA